MKRTNIECDSWPIRWHSLDIFAIYLRLCVGFEMPWRCFNGHNIYIWYDAGAASSHFSIASARLTAIQMRRDSMVLKRIHINSLVSLHAPTHSVSRFELVQRSCCSLAATSSTSGVELGTCTASTRIKNLKIKSRKYLRFTQRRREKIKCAELFIRRLCLLMFFFLSFIFRCCALHNSRWAFARFTSGGEMKRFFPRFMAF